MIEAAGESVLVLIECAEDEEGSGESNALNKTRACKKTWVFMMVKIGLPRICQGSPADRSHAFMLRHTILTVSPLANLLFAI